MSLCVCMTCTVQSNVIWTPLFLSSNIASSKIELQFLFRSSGKENMFAKFWVPNGNYKYRYSESQVHVLWNSLIFDYCVFSSIDLYFLCTEITPKSTSCWNGRKWLNAVLLTKAEHPLSLMMSVLISKATNRIRHNGTRLRANLLRPAIPRPRWNYRENITLLTDPNNMQS